MSRYKVLPVPNLFRREIFELAMDGPYIDSLQMIKPIFDRHGFYYDRETDVCWVECYHGAWIIGNKRDFDNELHYQSYEEDILHPSVIDAFKTLRTHNLLPKDLQEKWWAHQHAADLRYTCREASKWRVSFQKERKEHDLQGQET